MNMLTSKNRKTPSMTDEDRQRISPSVLPRVMVERRLTWNLIHDLIDAGFTPHKTDVDAPVGGMSALQMFESIHSVDECRCYFKNAKGKSRWFLVVLGNDGYDAISDWGCPKDPSDGWDELMGKFCDSTEARFTL